jgi:type II secretion system protein D
VKQPIPLFLKLGLLVLVVGVGIYFLPLLRSKVPEQIAAQSTPEPAPPPLAADSPQASPDAVPTALPPHAVPSPAPPQLPPPGSAPMLPGGAPMLPGMTGPPGSPFPPGVTTAGAPPRDVQADGRILLSFQNANIDMIVQWLARITGKSVVKHPQVRAQLTIVSSEPLAPRDAIELVYRALSLEGGTVVESDHSILLVPAGQEPKLSPMLLDRSVTEIPAGRQQLVRFFTLENVPAIELRDKIKGVLSETAKVEVDERGNQLIVTDYNDNIRLLSDLIPNLDVVSPADTVIEMYALKHTEAEDLAALLNLVLNERGGVPPSSSPSPTSGSSQSMPMMGPGGPMPSSSSGSTSSSASAIPQASGQVRLWPDRISNRLIVAAPRSRIGEIQDLIETLDAERPADVSIRVIPLQHAAADDLIQAVGPLFQRLSGRSLKEAIEVTASTRANSLIVLSSESNFKLIQGMVTALDTDDAQEQVLKAFPLVNADAEDVARQLQDLHRPQQPSLPFYYFSPARTTQTTRGVNVVADRRRNTIIVQAPPLMMPSIAQMIGALDEPVTDAGLAPRIYQLKYVSSVDIEDVLNELFLKRTQPTRPYWMWDESPSVDRDVGRLYGRVRITSEPYSNSIIITANSVENLAAVEEVLQQLDVPSQAGESTLRVPLRFADAVIVATSVNILFARGGSPPLQQGPQQAQPWQGAPGQQPQPGRPGQSGFELEREVKEDAYFPWLGGQPETYRTADNRTGMRPVSDLVGRVRVVPDRRSNSILLTSNVHFFPQVLKLIHEMDEPTAQVLIEAKIIEVTSDFRERLGVRWSPDGARVFDAEDMDHSVMPSAAVGFQDTFIANTLRTGVLDASVNLDLLVQFLRRNTDAAVLAEPQISIRDNELGRLFVGAQVPFITQSQLTPQGVRNDSFEYRDVGVILEVTPNINSSDEVVLRIRTESSNIRAGETLFGGAILDTRNFRTDVLVRSGETLVLGGIIQQIEGNTIRKVPLLGDIPVLGWAFKKRDAISREVELMVFLRPIISRTPEDVRAILEESDRRTPQLRRWRERLDDPMPID